MFYKINRSMKRCISVIMLAAMLLMGLGGSLNARAEDQKGSITLHLLSSVVEGSVDNHSGEAMQNTSGLGTPLKGAEWSLYRLTMPTLAENEEYTGEYIVNEENASVNFTTTATTQQTATGVFLEAKTTDDDGVISWTNLDVNTGNGNYLLIETKVPDNAKKAAASVISLPLTKEDGSGSNFDVHVYPKNVSTTLITKKVDTTNRTYSMGDDVPFTINAAFKNEAEGADTVNGVDDLKKDGTYGSLKIKDSLVDALKYKESSLTLMKADGSSEGLSMGTDYSLEGDATGKLVWTLTDNGIDKAIAAHATAVEVKLTTTVQGAAESISNKASSEVTRAGSTNPGPTPVTPETKVPVASITVNNVGNTKANEATFDQMLGGAKFKLASDAAGTNFVKGVDGKDMEVTADANGLATFAGVPYTAAIGNTYYLVETQAPVGYQLKGASIKVELQKDQDKDFTQTVLVKHYIAGSTDPDNPKFKLPLTGGAGTMVFTIGGLMLIGLAATLGCLYYKKR